MTITLDSPVNKTDTSFPELPSFDERAFQPPQWATSSNFQWVDPDAKRGESSRSTKNAPTPEPQHETPDEASSASEDEAWESASEGVELVDDTLVFTTPQLRKLVNRAVVLKQDGNALFKAEKWKLAIDTYKSALDVLPDVSKPASPDGESSEAKIDSASKSGLEEVSEDEAAEIEAALQRAKIGGEKGDPAKVERDEVEEEIRECTKACWSNTAACHARLGNDKEVVTACTEALKIDKDYIKALQRRAEANDRINSWSSLSTVKEDYTHLLTLVPSTSSTAVTARRVLATLPARTTAQQQKETEEMMAKLKDMGNSLLGHFGLNTDMFKFDKGEGGGYNMSFQQ